MENLKKLIKSSFDLWVKKRWLNEINRSVDRYHKYRDKADRERYVLNKLIEEYNNIYHEELRGEKYGRANQ